MPRAQMAVIQGDAYMYMYCSLRELSSLGDES
jgi:hypothetical protein